MMMMTIALVWALALAQAPAPAAPPPPPATFIGSAEIESTLRESIANNTLDKRVALAPGPRGIVRVGIVHRSKQEPRARLHDELTEVCQILECPGALVTR